jgi:diguanylate cyclase (GGDEF)-like protein
MPAKWKRRRVLLAAAEGERRRLRELFAGGPLHDWEVVEADSCRQARFVRQLDPCDLLVVDDSLPREAGELEWLAGGEPGPVLFLADVTPEGALDALRQGADTWLPRTPALEHPALLAAALERLAAFADAQRETWAATQSLADCRRQCDRLVDLLWAAVPGEGPGRWLSQRHLLERFEEEVARSRRHGDPLAVVLGEVRPGRGAGSDRSTDEAARAVAAWTARRVSEVKRRSDVAGQYGLHGFMMLLPQTTEAGAAGCCRRLEVHLRPPADGTGPPPPLHTCFGVAAFAPDMSTTQGLLRRAEESLEEARTAAPDTP